MERRLTLLVPGRARSQIIKPDGERGYFHSLYVDPGYRRQGYGLELMKFAIQYAQEFLEMDILRCSKACQRNAAKIGYRKTAYASDRYLGCDLWRYRGTRLQLPISRLQLLSAVHYERTNGRTEVLYLSNQLC
jgi:GNAT superfamily N-acetyltransferase